MTAVEPVEHVDPHSLEHDALVYGSDEEYLAALLPLIEAALDAGDHVFAVVSHRNAGLLREALGSAGLTSPGSRPRGGTATPSAPSRPMSERFGTFPRTPRPS